ncbi:hypothetical protein AD998_12140 [bacterium 336/3]|nr:hypothetical protein AD998_12140 [bacterium 336/3]
MASKFNFKALSLRALFLIYFVVAIPLMYLIISQSLIAQKNKNEYARILSFEERFLKLPSLIQLVTSKQSSLRSQADEYSSTAQSASDIVLYGGIALGLISLGFLISIIRLFFQTPNYYQTLWYGIFGVSLICLLIGISTPILEILAFEDDLKIEALSFVDLPIKGEIIFYHQNKSILDVIGVLFEKGNYLVGICIFLFSLVIPFGKLILGGLSVSGYYQKEKIDNWIQKIGKWSMADVFVVAIFLSFMSFNNFNTGISTKSDTLIGFYFFLVYCMLSIYAGIVAQKHKKKMEEKL